MPWHIPEDLKHFKEYTTGKSIVMGRKTYQSLGKPLPNRTNIVISRFIVFPNVVTMSSLEQVLGYKTDELVIIGGARIYAQTIDIADKLIITHVDSTFDADTYFPNIDKNIWKETSSVENKNEIYSFKFVEYSR